MNNDIGLSILDGVHDFESRLQRASGIRLMPAKEAAIKNYFPGAAVPLDDWQMVTGGLEIINGVATGSPSEHSRIGIISIGIQHTADLLDITLKNQQAGASVANTETAAAVTLALEEHLCRLFYVNDGSMFRHGVIGKRPGLQTVTVDSNTGMKPGMHLDSWDRSQNRTKNSKIRINVNLGPEPRYFLFLSQSIAYIDREVSLGKFVQSGENTLYYQYLARNQSLPIYRLKIMPGEAYIAATDCIIHDASTIDCKHDVYTLQVRGALRNDVF